MAYGSINIANSNKSYGNSRLDSSSDSLELIMSKTISASENIPAKFLYSKNGKDLYFYNSNYEVRKINVETGVFSVVGATLNSGSISMGKSQILIAHRYLYDKNSFALISDLGASTFSFGNNDGFIYRIKYENKTITLYKIKTDNTEELIFTSTEGFSNFSTGNPTFRTATIDVENNCLRLIYTYVDSSYYPVNVEYDLTTGSATREVRLDNVKFSSLSSSTTDISFVSLGSHAYVVRAYNSSSAYVQLYNMNATNGTKYFHNIQFQINANHDSCIGYSTTDKAVFSGTISGETTTNTVVATLMPQYVSYIDRYLFVGKTSTSSTTYNFFRR